MTGLVLCLLIVLMAVFADFVAPYGPHDTDSAAIYSPPQLIRVIDDAGRLSAPHVLGFAETFDPVTYELVFEPDPALRSNLGLFVAGNLAAVILSDTTPSPQRISSLIPILAILAAVAVTGILGFLPGPGESAGIARTAIGTLILGAVWTSGLQWIPHWGEEPSPDYGGDGAAVAVAAWRVLPVPRYRGEEVILEGPPHMDSAFATIPYLMPATRFRNRDLEKALAEPPPSGLHLITEDWTAIVPEWRTRYGITRGIPLPDPRNPHRDIGYLIRVP